MESRTKLRTLCETRWTSRADSLYTFKTAFPVVIHALEQLEDDGDQKAKQYLSAIMKFDFIISLVIAEHIMKSTVYLSVFLQGKECDLVEAMKECKVVVDVLPQERADESVWDELYQSAVDIGQPLNIQESMPRRVGRQCHRDNHPVDTP
ncbi:hypothetical protein KUTeg_003473 [Tegillarca granosa]|uniref:Uncharacterized protein n=1 Tax=Tegillarca granosa TaxID=220873 RepID=A0ABQ9FM77_TEGGR|nr:hypothetical protein KUTeg_003473 [Tegillarca granosa]